MKIFIKKIIKSAFTGLIIVGTLACDKEFLDKKPVGEEITPDFFNSQEGAVKATNAIYWQLRQWPTHVFAFIGISNITSDDADKGSEPGDAPFMGELDAFTFPATNFFFNDFWNGQYTGIAKANEVIQRVPLIEMDEVLKSRLIGEAKFLRAYFYFNLVRTFGGVPKIVTIATDNTAPTPRSSKEEIYQLIKQDLTEAIAVLPEKKAVSPEIKAYPEAELGRATKGAAKGLLAKVHMYLKEWAEVQRLTDEVMASGQYDLNTPYEKIFTEAGENSSESVFEVQAAATPQCGLGSQYAEVQSVRGQLGWGFNTPSEDLLNAYELNDPRKEATIMSRGENMGDGFIVAANAPNPRYNQKAYVSQSDPKSGCGMGDAGKNIRLLRYADVVLMNAEAANELGTGVKAASSLNMVRARARGTNVGILPDVTFINQTQMRDVIWRERRVELAMEHDRFWDLVRQGRAAQVLNALGKSFVAGKHELMPIPQTQIDASGGILTQNPGY